MAEERKTRPEAQPAPDLLKNFQSIVSAVVGLAAIFTASGFLIVKTYLSLYTDAHSFNIVPAQYLSAAIIPWLFIAALGIPYALQRFQRPKSDADISWLAARLYPELHHLAEGDEKKQEVYRRLDRYTKLFRKITESSELSPLEIYDNAQAEIKLLETEQEILQIIDRIKTSVSRERQERRNALLLYVWIPLFIVASLVIGILYGAAFYDKMPRVIGGGQPASITLILKDDVAPENFGLTPADPTQPHTTRTLLLLAELTDGLLVRDPQSKTVVIIKNDVINGIADNELSQTVAP